MTSPLIIFARKATASTLALAMMASAGSAMARPGFTQAFTFVDVTRPSSAPRLTKGIPAAQTPFSNQRDDSLPPYLQCVPYARLVSGVQITGDALTWWKKAEGRYARGFVPKAGAVMAFKPHGAMVLGHVAAVSRVLDSRTVLLRHANWSPINGRRGQIEDDVRAVDVSPKNDWSEVRVWFGPLGGLGTTRWPVEGFIYNRPAPGSEHGATRDSWMRDPIGAIIAAFSRN